MAQYELDGEICTNLAYRLDDGEVASRAATDEELSAARAAAKGRPAEGDYALRSCWNCNPAHSHFLSDLNDGFLFVCFDCGKWYYQGIDITSS